MAEYSDTRAVDESAVLRLSAAWACVNLVAGTIASLPVRMVRKGMTGQLVEDACHPLATLLHDSPNYDQTALDFWEFIAASIELRGNGYAEIKRADNGRIVALDVPIAPQTMHVSRSVSGGIDYRWTSDGKERRATERDMLHIRGFGGNPLGGLSTLQFGAGVFGGAMSIETAASATFRNGIRPSGVLQSKDSFSPEQRAEAEALLAEKYRGAMNAGTPMLLDRNLEFKAVTMNPEDAQMLQSRAFSVEDICRMFQVPPVLIGHTEKQTSWGTGVEQITMGFVMFNLRRRLKRIEQSIAKQLIGAPERAKGVKAEFVVEGLLRGDSKARGDFYASGLQNGWRTINEVRALENLPPVEGGDVPRMQMQNVPITQVPDASADGVQG